MLEALAMIVAGIVTLWLFFGFLGWMAEIIASKQFIGWHLVLWLPISLIAGPFALLSALEDRRR